MAEVRRLLIKVNITDTADFCLIHQDGQDSEIVDNDESQITICRSFLESSDQNSPNHIITNKKTKKNVNCDLQIQHRNLFVRFL